MLELAKWRVGRARRRSERLFLHRIRPSEDREAPKVEEEMFPPRRLWHRYRRSDRGALPGPRLNQEAVVRAMRSLRHREDKYPWAVKLNEFIRKVQERALQEAPPRIEPPKIIGSVKKQGETAYRALSVFPLREKIIGCIAAKYLRECLDPVFDAACLAFRCARDGKPAPRHHDAVRKILNIRKRHKNKPLYVAECDIQGFFDCVDHQHARRSFLSVVREAERKQMGLKVDPRALALFDAYLDCYTFPRNVKRWGEPQLKKDHPDRYFAWPEAGLREFHKDPTVGAIGIPQGGALSSLVANCLLHEADKVLRLLARRSRPTFCYLRYCDDMIILSPDRNVCSQAFELYCREVKGMKLPIHEAETEYANSEEFWKAKSRATYSWGPGKQSEVYPWIQFVGYQIRYDGVLRVRSTSISKQRQAITHAANELLKHINGNENSSDGCPQPIRKSKWQIEHRFLMRVISMSVGRRTMWKELEGPLPMSWCSGFKCLDQHPFVIAQLKSLDRHRERQLRRVSAALAGQELPKNVDTKQKEKALPFYFGYPFSYVGQYRRCTPKTKGDRPKNRPHTGTIELSLPE